MERLQGKVAIITGAGSGIGRAGAMLFAREGAAVVLAEIDPVSGERVAAAIREEGGESLFIRTDVGDEASVREMVRRTEESFGGVDILFTNAAEATLINQQDACAVDLPEAIFDRIHRVILRGVFLCAKYAGQAMIRQGAEGTVRRVLDGGTPAKRWSGVRAVQRRPRIGGSMIFTATVDAQVGCAGLDAYTAAKGGVLALTRSLAAGLAPHGIRVNAISPGFVATEPQRVFLDNPASRAEIEALHLLPVPAPEEVVPLALFLASDEARAVTGSIYPIDAGYTAFKCRHVDVKDAMNRH